MSNEATNEIKPIPYRDYTIFGVLSPIRWFVLWIARAKWHHNTARKFALLDLTSRCLVAADAADAGGYSTDADRLRDIAEILLKASQKAPVS